MKLETLFKCTLTGGTAALVLAVQIAGAQQKPVEPQARATPLASRPFPAELAAYKARLFELTEPGEKKYDARFAHQLQSLVAPQVAKNAKFLARLMSGPTDVGTYVVSGQHAYIYYGICQAHQCDNTTMDILFDPARNRMVGKLLDSCVATWLGQPAAAEMALLDQRHHATFPASVTTCAGEK